MKIAIQGHPTRGKEVIQILESLGGKNNANIKGTFKKYYYFIDLNGTIDYTEYASKNIHTYTLENIYKKHLLELENTEFDWGHNVKHNSEEI